MTKDREPSHADNIRILLEVHDRHRERLNVRMSYGWKISLALWSALAVLAVGLLRGSVLPEAPRLLLVLRLGCGLLFAVYVWWVFAVGHRNYKDRNQAMNYMKLAERALKKTPWYKLLGEKTPCESKNECWPAKYHSQILQTIITLVLVGFVALGYLASTARYQAGKSKSAVSPSERTCTTQNVFSLFYMENDNGRCSIGND